MAKKIEVKHAELTDLMAELIDEQCVTNLLLEEIRHLTASSMLIQARQYDRVAPHPGDKTYREAEEMVADSYKRVRLLEDEGTQPFGPAHTHEADGQPA